MDTAGRTCEKRNVIALKRYSVNAWSKYEVALIGAISVIFKGTKLRFVRHEVAAPIY